MKTPNISVSSNKKAIMYSLTRTSIPQLAQTTIGIIKVVNRTKRMLIPSTPNLYFKPIIHSASSTIWKPVFSGSNCAIMNKETKNVTPVAKRANLLATRPAARSFPLATSSKIRAETAGVNVTMESKK